MTTTPRSPTVTVGPYQLLAKIGEGGMGIVHLARRPGGDRVALKVLRPHIVGDDEARQRLAREVSSLSRIRSRWVAEIVDSDPWAPVPYVATRYVPGLSLHDHVAEEGPLAGRNLIWFATCLAEGLASVHAVGVLHRDIKPSNVLMEGRTPILIDFGLARVADDPKLTHTGWLLGTPGYLAPEILYGENALPASDVHSWASTVVFAASGNPPFGRGPSVAIMDRVRRGEHDLTGVPLVLHDLLTAALDPDPAARPTLEQVLGTLRPVADAVEGDRRLTERLPVLGATPRTALTPMSPVAPTTPRPPTTLPVGHVAAQRADRPTDVQPPAPPPATRVLTQIGRPLAPPPPPVSARPVLPRAAAPTVVEEEPDDPWAHDPWAEPVEPTPVRVGLAERARRAVLLLVAAAGVGVATAAYPWWTLSVLVLAVWLLRSGSLAATAAGDRRRLRGRAWYDGVLLLVRAPWDLVRSLPGTLLLLLWSGGLAVSAALLCYAAATSMPIALGVIGAALALSVWTGPGSSRVRGPLGRVVRPVARPWRSWLVAVVVLVALGLGLGLLLGERGPSWSPGRERPLQQGISFSLP